ncbi:MAG: glycosyltransferase, partial [Candidatus Margulisiibacteriota bacterium]
MKILHIAPIKIGRVSDEDTLDIFPGMQADGPTRSVLGLSLGLCDWECEVGVLSTRPLTEEAIRHFGGIKMLTPIAAQAKTPYISAVGWVDAIESEFGKPDLVNFHDVYDFAQCAIAREIKRRGWIYTVTPRGGLRKIPQKRSFLKKKLANMLFFSQFLRNAAFITALCAAEKQDIAEFDSQLTDIIVAPNGIAESVVNGYSEMARKTDSDTPLMLGYIGQFDVEIKGLDLLFGAFRRLKNEGRLQNVKLVLAGQFKARNKKMARQSQDEVASFIHEMAESGHLEMKGPVFGNNKWSMLADMDVFVLTSRTEGMPVAVLEAMAFQRPCLVTEGTNMAQFVADHDAGWACETT